MMSNVASGSSAAGGYQKPSDSLQSETGIAASLRQGPVMAGPRRTGDQANSMLTGHSVRAW